MAYLQSKKNRVEAPFIVTQDNSIELTEMPQLRQSSEGEDGTSIYDPVVIRITSTIKFTLSQLSYCTFMLIGVALLWPWNCFLSASAYYSERFANSVELVKVYSSTMMTVSTLTSTAFNYYLSRSQKGVNYNKRVNLGLSVNILVFIIMAFSCVMYLFINMPDVAFFTFIMSMVLVSSLCTCLAQTGTMAIVNVLGSIYANAVMVGQAIAGVLPSVALIVSILLVGDRTSSTKVEKNYGVFVYYITASLVSAASMSFLWLVNSYKSHEQYRYLEEVIDQEQDETPEEEDIEMPAQVSSYVLWSKLKLIVMTIFFTFSITLIFPVFASTVESVHYDSKYKIFHKDLYIPFIYLIWNIGDLLGRILCGTPGSKLLIKNPKTLIVYSLGRLCFIPLFLTCNIHPYTSLDKSSAYVNSDVWYIFLQLAFGLSNGQLSTSSFMIVGDFCDTDEEKQVAGSFTSLFLSMGLAFGSVLSYLLALLIN